MLWVNRLFCLIIVFIILLPEIAFADSNGIVFDWQPFVVKDFRNIHNHNKKILEYSKIYREISKNLISDDLLLNNNLRLIDSSHDATADKSVLSKIKVSFSTISSFMLPYDEMQSRRYDGKFSRAASLLQNPSHDMATETLKLIEPQVNLGLEF